MNTIFTVQDRQEVFDYILASARECDKIVSLVQVGSGAYGYNDDRSDLDFVIALDTDGSMPEVMEYIYQKIAAKYDIAYHAKAEASHLQVFMLSNLLEIDLGYGGYEHAAARKPAFKVLYDNTGVVEEKMVKSREWMDNVIYGDKQKKDIELACSSFWSHLMHAALAIRRSNQFRAIGELEFVRKLYIDLLGDRYRLESGLNREMDKLPEEEKAAIRSTFVNGEDSGALWTALSNLTELIYAELEGQTIPVSKEMLLEYYKGLR